MAHLQAYLLVICCYPQKHALVHAHQFESQRQQTFLRSCHDMPAFEFALQSAFAVSAALKFDSPAEVTPYICKELSHVHKNFCLISTKLHCHIVQTLLGLSQFAAMLHRWSMHKMNVQ